MNNIPEQETTAPFITSMGNYLLECQRRATLPEIVKSIRSTAQWDSDRAVMYEIVDKGMWLSKRHRYRARPGVISNDHIPF